MDRVPTGIAGLDKLIDGGIPRGATVLLSGGSGTLKTITSMQYLYNGAKQYNEPGIYVTLEEEIKNISWNMETFGWDIHALEEAGKMKLYRLKLDIEKDVKEQIEAELKQISLLVKKMGAKRLVIDSTTSLGIWIPETGFLRYMLYQLASGLKEMGVTTILTAETKGGRQDFSAFGVEEFVADGVIALYFTPPNRSIFVRKMRGTSHSKSVHPVDVTPNGIEVKYRDEVMWESIK